MYCKYNNSVFTSIMWGIMYNRYCELRERDGLTDYQVAKSIGVNQTVFSDWRRGKSEPKNDKLVKLARFFGVTLDWLVTGEDAGASAGVPRITQDAPNSPLLWELLEEAKKANTDDLKAVLGVLKRLNSYSQKG